MPDQGRRVLLGRTGLSVARVGLGASFGAPTAAYEEAFERGLDYFYWGSLRKDGMGDAIRSIARQKREKLVVVIQSYARFGFVVRRSLESALRRLRIEQADVLLLGWHNSEPSNAIVDAASELVEKGRVRHVALSGHRRSLFPTLIDDDRYGLFHVRYNAVHRGAEREVFPALSGKDATRRPGLVAFTATRWGHLCDARRTPPGERTPTGSDCYRFALSHPAVDVVLCGPDRREHVHQALAALDLGAMTEDELAWMRRVGDHVYRGDVSSTVRDQV